MHDSRVGVRMGAVLAVVGMLAALGLVTGSIRFGGDHTGQIDIDLTYERTG